MNQLFHTIRFNAGNWQQFFDVERDGVGRDIGQVAAFIACGTAPNGDLHLCVNTVGQQLFHTIRFNSGDLQQSPDDVRLKVDIQDTNTSSLKNVACAAAPNGDLHVCLVNTIGKLFHTIRFAASNWQQFFGDVQQAVGGQDIGEIGDIACGAAPNGDLHVCCTPVVV